MSKQKRQFPHIYLPKNGKVAKYTKPKGGGGGKSSLPDRDRATHAKTLEKSISDVLQEAEQQLHARNPNIADETPGFYLEFELLAEKSHVF